MKKNINIAGISFDLYCIENNQVEKTLLDSRTYNSGMDYFIGSDGITVHTYLVKKEQSPLFIKHINHFIKKIEDANFPQVNYLESLNDFNSLHKVIENEDYDIFISHFNLDYCTEQSQPSFLDYEIVFNHLIEEPQSLSEFSVIAGAAYNDETLDMFALSFLSFKNPKQFKKLAKSFQEDWIEDGYSEEEYFSDFPSQNNTENEEIISTFIRLYFLNIPKPIEEDEYISIIHQML